jgi:hypothetical protein
MAPEEQSEIRKHLLPSYIKIEFDKEFEAAKAMAPRYHAPPAFDPAVAAAIEE